MKRRFLLPILLLICAVILLPACETNTKTDSDSVQNAAENGTDSRELSESVSNPDEDENDSAAIEVSVAFPKDWEPDANSPHPAEYRKGTASFMIMKEFFKASNLNELVKQAQSAFKGTFQNIEYIDEVKSVSVGGKDARALVFTCDGGSERVKYAYVYFMLGKEPYSAVFVDTEDSFDTAVGDYEQLLESISLAQTPAQAQAQTPEQTPADTQGPSSSDKTAGSGDGEVVALFAKSKAIKEISFEYAIIEEKEEVAKGKAWVKGSRVKNEITVDGQTMTSIFDTAKAEAYMYVQGEKTATLSELTPEMTGWFQSPTNFYDDVDVSMVKIVDTETIDGHKCKVMSIVDDTGWEESKMWVSEEYGIPLRIQTDDALGLLILEYNNVKVGSVPDAAFELPPGVEILDMRTPK